MLNSRSTNLICCELRFLHRL